MRVALNTQVLGLLTGRSQARDDVGAEREGDGLVGHLGAVQEVAIALLGALGAREEQPVLGQEDQGPLVDGLVAGQGLVAVDAQLVDVGGDAAQELVGRGGGLGQGPLVDALGGGAKVELVAQYFGLEEEEGDELAPEGRREAVAQALAGADDLALLVAELGPEKPVALDDAVHQAVAKDVRGVTGAD